MFYVRRRGHRHVTYTHIEVNLLTSVKETQEGYLRNETSCLQRMSENRRERTEKVDGTSEYTFLYF